MGNEITRHLGTCPVCEGEFKLTSSNAMVHHGYKRPGHGSIQGDCYAVGCLAYELSCEATKSYRARVQEQQGNAKAYLARLQAGEVTQLERESRVGGAVVVLHAGEPGFKDLLDARVAMTQARIRAHGWEIERLTKLVDGWTLRPVKTVQEEATRKAASAAEVRATKAAAKAEKLRARIEGFQKRIDSAVRRKNAAALADIFESIVHNLRSELRAPTKQAALQSVGRDHVWSALGFVQADGTLDQKAHWYAKSERCFWPADLS